MSRIALAAALLAATTALGFAAEPAKVAETSMGKVYTDAKGMTLYTFDRDEAGKSNCNDNCAKNWPPFMAAADAKAEGKWTIVARADGTKMWALGGKPVYTYVKDTKAGEMTGEGVNGVWHLAKAN